MPTGDVTTRYDGRSWTYDIDGEPPLGHSFDSKSPAVAGGRFLAQQRRTNHIILNEDDSVAEEHSFAEAAKVRNSGCRRRPRGISPA